MVHALNEEHPMGYSLDYNLGLYMVHALNKEHPMAYSLDYNCARISSNFQTTDIRGSYPTSSHVSLAFLLLTYWPRYDWLEYTTSHGAVWADAMQRYTRPTTASSSFWWSLPYFVTEDDDKNPNGPCP